MLKHRVFCCERRIARSIKQMDVEAIRIDVDITERNMDTGVGRVDEDVRRKNPGVEFIAAQEKISGQSNRVELTAAHVDRVPSVAVRRITATPEASPEVPSIPVKRITPIPEYTSASAEPEGTLPARLADIRVGSQRSGDADDEDGELAQDLDCGTEDATSESEELFSDESDGEDGGESSNDEGEVPQDVEELLDQLYKTESEAAEAQENLEEEAFAAMRDEVRAEFSETFSGSELDAAVEEEMNTYKEEWDERHQELMDQLSLLQEKLEDAGISLPDTYKGIEKQAPESCTTEVWKRGTHWAGHEPTQDAANVIKSATEELKILRPTRSQRGRLVDEGASGYLEKKLAAEAGNDGEASTSNSGREDDDVWSKVEDILHDDEVPQSGTLMGTPRWAAVYLASTPQQAIEMGLGLPGEDTVEEIGDIESERRHQYKVALANEKERGLTDQQRKSIKKVRDEDDVQRTRRKQKPRLKGFPPLPPLNSSKERQSRMGLADIRQSEKPVEYRLVASTNGVSGSGANEVTVDRGLDVIHLLNDGDDGTQIISTKDESGQGIVDVNETGVTIKTAPLEDGKELGRHATESGGDLLRHDGSRRTLPKTAASEDLKGQGHLVEYVHVKLEERNLSDSGSLPALEEIPPMHVVPPVPESSDIMKKRTHDDDCHPQGDGDMELTRKRCKILCIEDAEEISAGAESSEKNSDSLTCDTLPSPKKIVTYIVIDSDGEREIEEAVAESGRGHRTPSRSHHSESKGNGLRDPVSDSKKRKYRPSPMKGKSGLPCTACGTRLRPGEVVRHPKLSVGICKRCRKHYLSGPFKKDEDGSDSECSWCGEGGDVVCCDSCDKVFCESCITRNFGPGEALRVVAIDNWLCYFCNSLPLQGHTEDLLKAESDARVTNGDVMDSGGFIEDVINNGQENSRQSKKGRHRKNIRKVLDDDELEEKQKELLAREKERQERLEEWRRAAGIKSPSNPTRRRAAVREMADSTLDENADVINVARAENEAPVKIAPGLAYVLKEHQLNGARFMWENCIVSEQKVREEGESFGCILAHTMGLGKTLQVITFIHTVLNQNLGLKTALIVVPVNVLHNWKKEFEIWQAKVTNPVVVYMLEETIRENSRRAALLSQWKEAGGVMLIGYAAFRNLSLGKHVRDKSTWEELCQALQNPGPDLLVCDEAHTIKNSKADITQVLKQVKTRRRIALTGSPLQNNLLEYYCMVDFVRHDFLGDPQSFKNRFQNPIENGQHADSTDRDVRVMKQRAHCLHKQLKGFVQRVNTSVLKGELPPKCVYVIGVRLSPLQRRLYTHYLQVHGLLGDQSEATESKPARSSLFHAYHALAKVWNHPDLLLLAEEEKNRKQEDDDDFMRDSDEERFSDGEIGADGVSLKNPKGKSKVSAGPRPLKKKGSAELDEVEKPLWWKDMIPEDYLREDEGVSGKMVVLLRLLTMCSMHGDKALVFSQSLGTLGMIEKFLQKRLLLDNKGKYWERDKHWYRLDGSTLAASRMLMCDRFNDPSNTAVKCVLISTRAGSLGINLPAANRVIIVDGSWNPTHDLQALFRAWRLGQKKDVYAYRLLAHGTMEEKIYLRQVNKEGVAARVLDEHQVGRIFAGDDLENLFKFEDNGAASDLEEREPSPVLPVRAPIDAPNIGPGMTSLGAASLGSTSKSKLSEFSSPTDLPPKDEMMAKLLVDYRPRWIASYHQHEPLLEHREEETLTSEEQNAAWKIYQDESQVEERCAVQMVSTTIVKTTNTYTSIVFTKPSAGTSSAGCQVNCHAMMLNNRNVAVGRKITCAQCSRLISWEKIHGEEQEGPVVKPGG